MNRRTFLTACSGWPLLSAAGFCSEPTEAEINRLIGQLGSKKFKKREAASQALNELGQAAWPALLQAAETHPDAEVRRRARELVPRIGDGQPLLGHTGAVLAVDISPNSYWGLSSALDDTVRLWALYRGRQAHVIDKGQDSVFSLAFSPTGKRAALGGVYYDIRYVELPSGTVRRQLDGHTGSVYCVAFSKDGRRLLSGSNDCTARLWDVATGKQLHCFRGHTDTVRAVGFSADGRRAFSGGEDCTARIWDVATGKELTCVHAHCDHVFAVAVSANSWQAALGGNDGLIHVLNLRTRKEAAALPESVLCLAFRTDGRYLLSGDAAGLVQLWQLDGTRAELTRAQSRVFRGHTRRVTSVAFSPDGHLALSGSQGTTLRVWRMP